MIACSDEAIEYQTNVGLYEYAPESMQFNPERSVQSPWPIFHRDMTNAIIHYEGGDPSINYMPTWQTSPLFDGGKKVNENLLHSSYAVNGLNASFYNQSVVINSFFMGVPGDINSESSLAVFVATMLSTHTGESVFYAGDPLSQVYFPVFDSFGDDRKTVTTMVGWVHWMAYFRDVLPENSKGIVIVLKDSCGGEYTYEINGELVRPIGKGTSLTDGSCRNVCADFDSDIVLISFQ